MRINNSIADSPFPHRYNTGQPVPRTEACAAVQMLRGSLLENLLYIADFLLDFPGRLLVLALGLEIGVIRDLTGLF